MKDLYKRYRCRITTQNKGAKKIDQEENVDFEGCLREISRANDCGFYIFINF